MRRLVQRPHRVRLRMPRRLIDGPAALLDRGLALFPIPTGSKEAPAGWHAAATTDPATVASWPASGNLGVACRASWIVGIDLDRKTDVHGHQVDAVDTFRALCAGHRQPWPRTFTVSTAHDGLHLYFRAPDDVVIPSLIARWPGIDVRAPGRRLGGYLAAPGSIVDGRRYAIADTAPIAPLPAWLAHRLARRTGCASG